MSDDIRLGEVIKKNSDEGDVVLVGFPYDEGVKRNGGRIGASSAPSAVRRLISRVGTVVNPEFGIDLRNISVSDAGDIQPNMTLEEGHAMLTQKVQSLIERGKIPFVIGGGNDQSFANVSGLFNATASSNDAIGVVNIDAHLDVRPLKDGAVHSGSPFRLMLEHERFANNKNCKFVEFAAQGSQCSAVHAQYVHDHNGDILWLSTLREKGVVAEFKRTLNETFAGKKIFVSFDLDSVQSSDAPGVSCPGNVGLTSQEALDICFEAGKNPNVVLFDLSEFNPVIEDYRTGRLVCFMFYYFAMGVAARRSNKQQ